MNDTINNGINERNDMDTVSIKQAMDTIFNVVTHEGDRENIKRYIKTGMKERRQMQCDASIDADIEFLKLENVVEYVADEAYGDAPF